MQSIDDFDWQEFYYRLQIGQACFLLLIICTNIYFIARFGRISRVHLNFRILFSVLVIQYNVISLSRLVVHFVYYMTSNWFIQTWPNLFCIALSPLYSSGLLLSALTVFSLGLERLIATQKRHKYEQQNGSIAIILILVQIFLGLGVALGFVVYETIITDEFDVDSSHGSCLSTERYPDLMTFIWIFAGLTYVTGLLFFIWLYRKNKFLMTHPSDFSLTVRHQLSENLTTTGLVVPCVSLYGLALLVGIPLVCWAQVCLLNEGRNGSDFIVLTVQQLLLMTCDLYSFSFTFLAMLRFKPLNKQVLADIRRLFCIKVEPRPGIVLPTLEDKNNLYFEHLKKTWDNSFQEHERIFRERKHSRY